MRTVENKIMATTASAVTPFFKKESGQHLFCGTEKVSPFFPGKHTASPVLQRKCATCEKEENRVQRQEHPASTEKKLTEPETTQSADPIPLGRQPRAANCTSDLKFPNLGCYGQQLKLDIDENLFNNAHQFNRVATLFPGDTKLMLDTFFRYGLGKNLLDTTFGFAGANKKWSSILSYGTGIALKSYGAIKEGNIKLDLQIPMGKGVNLDVKFDYTTKPESPGDEKGFNTAIGVSGSW